MTDIFAMTAHLPVLELAPGDVLVTEGGPGGGIWVLEAGLLQVSKGGIVVTTIALPGSVIGEVSVLIGTGHTATVAAIEPSRLRHAADGLRLLADHPELTWLVAVGLAERLAFVTSYLSDLQRQYGDAPGLAMVGDVLRRLEQRRGPRAVPGSARDPDPPY